jgi:8-oxo-dGTP diphosphatase
MHSKLVRVAPAVIRRDGQYRLAKRPAHKAQGGFWEFPGGKLEPGETAQAALARELAEELDARGVGDGELVGAADQDYGSVTVRIEAYRVTCDLASLRNLDHDEMGWFAPASFNRSGGPLPEGATQVAVPELATGWVAAPTRGCSSPGRARPCHGHGQGWFEPLTTRL